MYGLVGHSKAPFQVYVGFKELRRVVYGEIIEGACGGAELKCLGDCGGEGYTPLSSCGSGFTGREGVGEEEPPRCSRFITDID